MLDIIIVISVLLTLVSYAWVKGIDNMNENYPDYKGEDFFNEEDKNEIL
jgi:hypothetical protein